MSARSFRKLVLCLTLFLVGCASSAKSLILGRWHAEGSIKIAIEFSADGTSQFTMFGVTQKGVYRFTGPNEMEWNLRGVPAIYKVTVTATDLELTDAHNQTLVFRRT